MQIIRYLLVLLMGIAPAWAASPLVTVEWLKANINRPDVLVLDASPAQMHAMGHIPGAVNADVFSYGGRDISTAEMEKQVQGWGVAAAKTIVIYDQGGTYFATSLLFDLHYHGFPRDKAVVLDGGLSKWQAVGGAVTKDATAKPAPGTFKITRTEENIRARLPEFLVASGDTSKSKLVEALEPSQHWGADKFFDRAGHVPNAIMSPAADYFNADKTFKSPEELRRMLGYLGITPDQRVYSHCGGGIAASVPFFAMKWMLDYPDVKLYKESQLEWLRDDRGLPFWTYDAQQMLRDKNWVNGWNAKMLRAFGVARLNIIDVRPAGVFAQGRVPYSVNVPAEVFRRDLSAPAKLAEALGAAGIVPEHEAIIVSGGVLTPDAALAYLALERVGHKKISILADSVDDWAFAGLEIDKKPVTAATPRSYPMSLKPQVAGGNYPTVYIASGKLMPASVPAGKVVHLPYTDLLTANGSPKAASVIWDVLVKAGVPRYAEIVPFADDPGEAAVTYFVLKLMGYPDVKVL